MFKKLKVFYAKWKKTAQKIANFQVRVIFSIAYFIFIIPMGLIFKIFHSEKSGWQEAKETEASLPEARRQF